MRSRPIFAALLCMGAMMHFPCDAVASSPYHRQSHNMRTLQVVADEYRRLNGTLPVTDDDGTWYQKILSLYPGNQLDGFGATTDGSLPVDMYGFPLVYELPADPDTEPPIIRCVGLNGIDDGGALDDWDIRYGPNLGYWYKTEWPAIYRRAALCSVLAVLGLLLIWLVIPVTTPWRMCVSLLWLGMVGGVILPAGFAMGMWRHSASQPPPWIDTVATVSAGPLGLGIIFTASVTLIEIMLRMQQRRALRLRGCCMSCGYDLRGTLAAGRRECPECGAAIASDVTAPPPASPLK